MTEYSFTKYMPSTVKKEQLYRNTGGKNQFGE